MYDLSYKIKDLRKKNRISQKNLGKMLGISNRAVSKWENGISLPSSENLMKLSRIFGVSLDFFVENKKIIKENPCGMESISELYKIGCGPSSSHTIGPERACIAFGNKNNSADGFKVIFYGSLAKTGRGHRSDEVVRKTLHPKPCEVEFNFSDNNILHPNTMELFAYKCGKQIDFARVFSVGGGRIIFENSPSDDSKIVYKLYSFRDIADYCQKKGIRIWEYVRECENRDFHEYMKKIWDAMKTSILKGLSDEGILPGELGVHKKAKQLFNAQNVDETAETRENRIVCGYAFAVSEQNASGEKIVTAPTCGAAGVVPAVLYYQQQKRGYSDEELIHALETAGVIGNLIKTNASISGADCGCQVEIGSACAMAAAALAELFGLNIDKIEYAAEMAIEHHLGLTCDPIGGYVQIPCIERNAVAAMRAINAVNLADFLSDTRKISFDKVVEVMRETGRDMSCSYKETSQAGLAKLKI